MAIETEPGTSGRTGGGEPAAQPAARPWWMRPAIHTAIIGAVAGYMLGHWLGNLITSGYPQAAAAPGSPEPRPPPILPGSPFSLTACLLPPAVSNDLFNQAIGPPT